METANTLENKAKYLAQHWGQKVFKFRDGAMDVQKVGATYMSRYGIKNRYILLKPLSSITDEDAIEVADMCGLAMTRNYPIVRTSDQLVLEDDSYRFYISFETGYICIRKNGLLYNQMILKVYDYLRSIGYALPFMGLSVEQLIEYGWLKLSE